MKDRDKDGLPDLTMNEYAEATELTAGGLAISEERDMEVIMFLALAVNGEAGEVAEKVKKARRELTKDEPDHGYVETKLDATASEIGDVLWYLARLADELDSDLEEVAVSNLHKLTDRKERGEIFGDGDRR